MCDQDTHLRPASTTSLAISRPREHHSRELEATRRQRHLYGLVAHDELVKIVGQDG